MSSTVNGLAVCSWKEPSAQDIVSHSSDSSVKLDPDNIIIDVAKVGLPLRISRILAVHQRNCALC